MRRTMLVVLTGFAVLTASAYAAKPRTGTFEAVRGKVQQGFNMQFKVDRKGQRISKVKAFVLERCSGASRTTSTTVGPGLTWTVKKNGRFTGQKKQKFGQLTLFTTLEGRFTSPNKAVGTISQRSGVAGSTCSTGKLKFTATRKK